MEVRAVAKMEAAAKRQTIASAKTASAPNATARNKLLNLSS
jgi:hypothetical protein